MLTNFMKISKKFTTILFLISFVLVNYSEFFHFHDSTHHKCSINHTELQNPTSDSFNLINDSVKEEEVCTICEFVIHLNKNYLLANYSFVNLSPNYSIINEKAVDSVVQEIYFVLNKAPPF